MNRRCGLLVNSSRGIIYADNTERFANAAAEKAAELGFADVGIADEIPVTCEPFVVVRFDTILFIIRNLNP